MPVARDRTRRIVYGSDNQLVHFVQENSTLHTSKIPMFAMATLYFLLVGARECTKCFARAGLFNDARNCRGYISVAGVSEFCPAGVLLHASKSTDMSLSHLNAIDLGGIKPATSSTERQSYTDCATQADFVIYCRVHESPQFLSSRMGPSLTHSLHTSRSTQGKVGGGLYSYPHENPPKELDGLRRRGKEKEPGKTTNGFYCTKLADEIYESWWREIDDEIYKAYRTPRLNTKSTNHRLCRRLRWAGHVARMGESRNAYRVLVGRPEGKRPLGRPRRRWEDNIKMDLREVGYDDRDWINLAQDRDQWRAYVRAAMNLQVP
ncbi:hypothetical protein ANN_10495 [Periplaneta americana]|uniref:Uncharacterized protein n=1 Tax=Periplaneta americana TaxID=6978 RepID=A0ABQ8TP67_PERAM|nr:hypothetical protein ANN_10495 [Periplaneta americana]